MQVFVRSSAYNDSHPAVVLCDLSTSDYVHINIIQHQTVLEMTTFDEHHACVQAQLSNYDGVPGLSMFSAQP